MLVYEGADSRSYIRPLLQDESDPFLGFLVKNDNNQRIYLLALDACFFRSDDPKRCDCLIFDNHCISFVELKINVRRQGTQKLKDAVGQLDTSILFFKTNVWPVVQNLADYRLEAYVAMKDTVYPRNSASWGTSVVRFGERHRVELFRANTKSF